MPAKRWEKAAKKRVEEEAATAAAIKKRLEEEAASAAAAKKRPEEGKAKLKPLTRGQLSAKALKQCKKARSKHKRVQCEKLAKKKYGPQRITRHARSSGDVRN